MRQRDIELITALAEGRLEDETEARALLAGSAALRATYDEQVAVIAGLRSLPRVGLTEGERTELRRSVWTGIRSDSRREPARARLWGLKPVSVAAVAVLLAGVAVVFASLAGDFPAVTRALDAGSDGVVTSRGGTDGTATPGDAQGGESGPLAVTEEAIGFRRLAEAIRDGTPQLDEDYQSLADQCTSSEDLTGLRPIGSVDLGGIEYETWVPDEQIGPETPITFVDPTNCRVVHTEE